MTAAPGHLAPSDEPCAVVFISHDAWRTGAPIVLLHFLRWFKANTSIPFVIVLREGVGELQREFERLAPVFAWNEPSHRRRLDHQLRALNVGLIYSNTITNGEVLEALVDDARAVITHVHELGYWIRHRIDAVNLEQNRRLTSHFVAVSNAVKDNLVRNVGIGADRIDVVHDFVPAVPPPRTESRVTLRARLGIPSGGVVIGGSGTTDWRKAPDLFVQLAARARWDRPEPPQHFLWIGGECEGPVFGALWHDVVKSGVADRVHFVGQQEKPLDYFDAVDIFAMVSREDPFPLVCLEAASLGKPIVCFDRAGGARELVEEDAGIVVPYLDLSAMYAAIRHLTDNPQLRVDLGRRGAEKVRERYDVRVAAPRLLELIRRFVPVNPMGSANGGA